MLVVVPQARHEETPARLDHLCTRRRGQLGIGRHLHDVLTADQHARARGHGQVARIEQPRVADQDIGRRYDGLRSGELGRPCSTRPVLCREQLRQEVMRGGREHREPARDDRGRRAIPIEPDRCRGEVEPADLVLREAARRGRLIARQRANGLEGRFPRRQQREAVAGGLQQCAREDAQHLRRSIDRNVESLPVDGLLALLGAVVPGGLAVGEAEALGDRCLHVVVAAAAVFDRHTGGIQRPGSDDVVAAAAIVEGKLGARGTRVVGDGLGAGGNALDEDLVLTRRGHTREHRELHAERGCAHPPPRIHQNISEGPGALMSTL